METKTCRKCKQEKPATADYYYRRGNEFRAQCKDCTNRVCSLYREGNREKERERAKLYWEKNPERLKENNKRWRETNPERLKKNQKRWREENPEKGREYANRYYRANPEKVKEYNKRYLKVNPSARLGGCLRNRLRQALKGATKTASMVEVTGCTMDEVKQYLELQFREGMTWSNYGQWHIDHIVPCSAFDLTDPQQQKLCFHYTNLQPLWARDNLSKHAKLPHEWQEVCC